MFALGTTFLLVYYTNVAHINPALAASIIGISKFFDAASDLFMGHLLDHTHSRFGKARPWLLRISIPATLCLVATFNVPAGINTMAQAAYVFITYNLLSTVCMTVVSVSYGSLNSLITDSQYERGMNNIVGMTFYTVALLVFNSILLKMCSYFGDGDIYSQKGWTIAIAVVGVIMTICLLITFSTCKEMTLPDKERSQINKCSANNNPSFFRVLKALLTNRYWVAFVIAYVAMTITNGVIMGSALYYTQYVLGDASVFSFLALALYIAMLIGVVSTSIFIKGLGKRNTAIIGLAIMLAASVLTGLLPATAGNTAITLALRGFGVGFPSAFASAMLQDTLTYGKWKNGFDMVGMGNAANSFSAKIGSGVSTAMIGWLLGLNGFDSTQAVQSARAQNTIAFSFIWLPVIFITIALVCFILYKLDKEYPQCVADLREGRFAPGVVPYQRMDEKDSETSTNEK